MSAVNLTPKIRQLPAFRHLPIAPGIKNSSPEPRNTSFMKRAEWREECFVQRGAGGAHMIETNDRETAELYWLVFLLTGHRGVSMDITVDVVSAANRSNPFLPAWIGTWSRRKAITKAIGAIRGELKQSMRRTESADTDPMAGAAHDGLPAGQPTKARIEKALLAIDAFPRVALLLTIFEGAPISDAATLLETDTALVRKAQFIGLTELMTHLAGNLREAASNFSPALRFAQTV